ncbi:AmmeMemoRadiSam system protein B [bacterium]|nr:AmmeMemoRadiSam system protein B [bacterium]
MIISAFLFSSSSAYAFTGIRDSVYAGTWYPGTRQKLATTVDEYLKSAEIPNITGEVIGVIAPHAGYDYSAVVLAHAYKPILYRKVDVVILFGNAHREALHGVAIDNVCAYRTPLGEVELDIEIAKKLHKADPAIMIDSKPHQKEHSLEIQIPFLQRTLKPGFKIVPILFGYESGASESKIVAALPKILKDKTFLLVASTDLSHYPSYSDAKLIDAQSMEIMSTMDAEKLKNFEASQMTKSTTNLACVFCAGAATRCVMLLSKQFGADFGLKLKYANSGDIAAGDRNQVVGYGALALIDEDKNISQKIFPKKELDRDEQKYLLSYSRKVLDNFVRNGKIIDLDKSVRAATLHRGVFVTLHKNEDLRGCIGYIEPVTTCMEAVRDNTISACAKDPRFSPVTIDELDDVSIEISVLTPPIPVISWKDIKLGIHGIMLEKGHHRSVFLPQVPLEQGWDLETTLIYLALKAGLSADEWTDAKFKVFEAQVFHEKDSDK